MRVQLSVCVSISCNERYLLGSVQSVKFSRSRKIFRRNWETLVNHVPAFFVTDMSRDLSLSAFAIKRNRRRTAVIIANFEILLQHSRRLAYSRAYF